MQAEVAFNLESIKPSEAQILTLYELLLARQHNISHKTRPNFDDHCTFVRSKPYRKWYLINRDNRANCALGSVYVMKTNVIGLSLPDSCAELMAPVLKGICALHRPLAPIKSVRQAEFVVNVAPSNAALAAALRDLGATLIQHSYRIEL